MGFALLRRVCGFGIIIGWSSQSDDGACGAHTRSSGFRHNWRAQLKWQRLAPSGRFADMIERHWDGLATTYCRPENKVSLGFVERLINKMHVLQRRAYGLRDPEYLRLEVPTGMLPKH
jgi:transposase